MQEIKKKNTDKDMKNAFNVLISRWEKSGKSLSLRIWQQKLLKLKSKEQKDWGENQNRTFKNYGQLRRCNICAMRILERK